MAARRAKSTGRPREGEPTRNSRRGPDRKKDRRAEPTLIQALHCAYTAFNEGDVDAVLALMCEDIDWADTVSGGRKRGREAVRKHWQGLFELLSFKVEPLRMVEEPEGERVIVDVRQQVSDAGGKALAVQRVRHVFTFRGRRIAKMDALEPMP